MTWYQSSLKTFPHVSKPKTGALALNGHAPTVIVTGHPPKAVPIRHPKGPEISMSAAIVQIVGESDLSKKDLRSKLRERGFKDNQLGAYLYTAVTRLQKRHILRALPDGRIGKATAP